MTGRLTLKRISIAAVVLALAALLAVGLVELGGSASPSTTAPLRLSLARMRTQLAGSPAPLASLHEQASEVLGGSLPALRRRLAALHGEPVVINKWASWCEPCRAEFAVFQRVSVSMGHRVAFLGIDSGESSVGDARSFLRSFPVSYPSYYDASGEAGLAITESSVTPVTVFYDPSGGKFIHQGPYLSVAKLEQAVRRYALGV
jgi:cytochrome c biogenesis protein CcmG/thiol:disulfide interchange protein DsbE